MRDFNGRVAAITGAGSGIGRALALELAGRGARLALSDVDAAGAEETAAQCIQRSATARAYTLDVSDREAVFAHADAVASEFGTVNLIVNNAGVAMHQPVLETPIEDLEWLMGIDFWGVVYGTKAFLPYLIASGEGYVVNVSSVFGLIAVPGQAAYNSAKFAVRGFTEALRQEMLLAGAPVGVSCVHPGGVKTSIARSARMPGRDAVESAERFAQTARTTPAQAARAIVRGITRNRAKILVGPDAHAIDALQRALGSRYQTIVTRVAAREEARHPGTATSAPAPPEAPPPRR